MEVHLLKEEILEDMPELDRLIDIYTDGQKAYEELSKIRFQFPNRLFYLEKVKTK